jgi:4-amino-4-deoxy-L-arabinose transferase-like glycosyltransferase
MRKTKIYSYLLCLLVLAGVGLRLYQFGGVPISLNRDEAALGYNAYTLAHFGTDEWGKPYPLMFISFGDYKLPGYIYFLAPLIRMFGVHDWVIRLPSLIAGFVLILLIYLLTKRLTKNRTGALLAAALLSLSPWAIFYSRMAFEAHLALMWLVLTIYLLVLPFAWKRLILIGLTFGLAVLTYNTPLILAPALIVFCFCLPVHSLRQKFAFGAIMGGLMLVFVWFFLPLTAQKQNITIFSDPTINAMIRDGYVNAQNLPQKIAAHRYTIWLEFITSRFIQTWGPRFLVFKGGDHPWHSIPGWGHLLLTTCLAALIGIILTIFKKIPSWRTGWAYLILAGLSLLPAVVTVDAPHATRSLLFLFLLIIFAALPLIKWPKWYPLIILLLVLESSIYAYRYFGLFPKMMPPSWPTGLEAAIGAAELKRQANQPVLIQADQSAAQDSVMADQAYIYALLYSKTDPQLSFNEQPKDAAQMVRVSRAGHYLFNQPPPDTAQTYLIITRDANGYYKFQ